MIGKRKSAAVIGVAVMALIALAAAPAVAASEQYRGTAKATGVNVNVLGSRILIAGDSSALGQFIAAGILARGVGTGLVGAPGTPTSAELSAPGSKRVPATGETCATPDLVAAGVPPLLAGAIGVGAACSYAQATIASERASSHGQASIAAVNVSAEALAKVITDLIIPTLRTALGALLDPLNPNGTVGRNLTTAKDTVCAAVAAVNAALGVACNAAITTVLTFPTPVIGDLITAIENAIRNALRGVNLLAISLGGTASDVTTTQADVKVLADGSALTITSPSLKFLIAAINAAVDAVLNQFLTNFTNAVRTALAGNPVTAPLADQVANAVRNTLQPAVTSAISALTAAILANLPFLNSDEPLILVQGAPTKASALLTRATGSVARSSEAGGLVIQLNSALATFLRVPARTVIGSGTDQVLFAGTPLESRAAVGVASSFQDAADGITVLGAGAEGLTLELLRNLQGGIVLKVSGASAAAGNTQTTAPPLLAKTGAGLTSMRWLGIGLVVLGLAFALQLNSKKRSGIGIAAPN